MEAARVPYSVIGATALAVRGLPRMTRDLDLVVLIGDAKRAIAALRAAGLRNLTPTAQRRTPEPMILFVDAETDVEVDLLCAAGDPEATAIDESTRTKVFGVTANVATLEHLLLLYLYSNQPRHVGDFASIVVSKKADLGRTQHLLALMHPEMLPVLRKRIRQALAPPAPPAKPKRRPRG